MPTADSLAHVLAAHLEGESGGRIEEIRIDSTPLRGGYVSRCVERVDVEFVVGERRERRAFVKKQVRPNEARLLRLLQPVVASQAVPKLAAEGHDADGDWILVEFIDGRPLESLIAMPPDVIDTLLRIHTAFSENPERLSFLPTVDGAFWRTLLDAVELARTRRSWPEQPMGGGAVQIALDRLRRSDQVPRALHFLPRTLLHGDVHGGNMIESVHDRRIYLIDWGSARLGPAAVDLVNCIDSMHDSSWAEYWQRAARITGAPLPQRTLQIAFYVASAIVSVQYVPFAIRSMGEEHVHIMLERALDAVEALEALGI